MVIDRILLQLVTDGTVSVMNGCTKRVTDRILQHLVTNILTWLQIESYDTWFQTYLTWLLIDSSFTL